MGIPNTRYFNIKLTGKKEVERTFLEGCYIGWSKNKDTNNNRDEMIKAMNQTILNVIDKDGWPSVITDTSQHGDGNIYWAMAYVGDLRFEDGLRISNGHKFYPQSNRGDCWFFMVPNFKRVPMMVGTFETMQVDMVVKTGIKSMDSEDPILCSLYEEYNVLTQRYEMVLKIDSPDGDGKVWKSHYGFIPLLDSPP